MPTFEYKGINKTGKDVKGKLDADTVRAAQARLKKDGIFVTDIKSTDSNKGKKKTAASRGKASTEDISMMTRQLATLLKANIPLVDTLSAVKDQIENPNLKEALTEIRNQVNEGKPLFKSMAKYPKFFSKIYIYMCEAGEKSGTLDSILMRLAEFAEAQDELNKKIKSAMLYPVIMLIFTFGMLIGLFVYVIPKITTIFEQADMKLPWYSEAIIGFSDILVNYWYIIIVVFGSIIFLFRTWKKTDKGSRQWDKISLKLPVTGELARMVAVSRFTRTLSTLLNGGVPMLEALDIVKNVVNNYVLSSAIENARDNISEGETIAKPLQQSKQIPPLVIHMINIGEKTGELENMLSHVSDSYDFQVKTKISGLTSLLEPMLIVVMGVVIGIIVVAIMIPIFEMSNLSG